MPTVSRARRGAARGEVDILHLGVADGDEAGAVPGAAVPPQLRPIPHAGGDDDAIAGLDIMTQEIFGRRPGPPIARPIPAVGDDEHIRREVEQVAEIPWCVLVVEPRDPEDPGRRVRELDHGARAFSELGTLVPGQDDDDGRALARRGGGRGAYRGRPGRLAMDLAVP